MTTEKPASLVEELETLANTLQIWIDNEDGRIDLLRMFAESVAAPVKAGAPANISLTPAALLVLSKSAHLVLGLVGTARDLVSYRESLLPKPDPDMN